MSLSKALEIVESAFTRATPQFAMVALCRSGAGDYHRRHVRLRRDREGLYVRLGRRGMLKRYLKEMADARIVDAEAGLVVFYEQSRPAERTEGFYWIEGTEGMEPAQWKKGKWWTIGGMRGFTDDEVGIIGHRIVYEGGRRNSSCDDAQAETDGG